MSKLIPQDLSDLTKDELKALQTKITFLLQLQENFVCLPLAQTQGDTA